MLKGIEPPRLIRSGVPTHYMQVVGVDNGSSVCTGAVVAKGVVLTASHCVEKEGEPMVVTFENKQTRVFFPLLRGSDRTAATDILLLYGDTLGVKPWPIGNPQHFPQLGVFFSMNYRWDSKQHAYPCLILNEVKTEDGPAFRSFSRFDYGDSGGPVVDARFNVVGVVSRYETLPDRDYGLFSPTPSKAWLERGLWRKFSRRVR